MKNLNKPLACARVHIAGLGRVGTSVALALQAAGVGFISANDPQIFDDEQLSWCEFARRSDLGRPKVHVLERFFDGRMGFAFVPIVAPNESAELEIYLERADVIVSCANDLSARLCMERAAIFVRKPSVQAAVQDGRRAFGGIITSWQPGAGGSCFGCLFPSGPEPLRRGEILLPTVTRTIGNLAAHVALNLLAAGRDGGISQPNVLVVDIGRPSIERLAVQPRSGCEICGK